MGLLALLGGVLVPSLSGCFDGPARSTADNEGRVAGELVRQDDLLIDAETGTPFSGPVFATFSAPDDGSRHRLTLVDGRYDGPFEVERSAGLLSSKESYVDGVKHGPYEWYYESGEVYESGTYVRGELEGPYRAFWQSGEVYEDGTYAHGDFDGPRRWYRDGRLAELVTYQLGEIEGLYERYRADGTLELKGMLTQGAPCGTWIEGDEAVTHPPCWAEITQ